MSVRPIAISLCLVFLAVSATSGEAADLERLAPEHFLESVDPQERISGQNPVGVVLAAGEDRADPSGLYAFAPGWVGRIELSLSTVDGRYLVESSYRKKTREGWVHLEFPTRHPQLLAKYSLDEIAVVVRASDTGSIFPVRWKSAGAAPTVKVYVNTEGANAKVDGGRCAPPGDRAAFKFNFVCDVPVHAILAAKGAIEIKRKHGVRRLASIVLHVDVPPSRD